MIQNSKHCFDHNKTIFNRNLQLPAVGNNTQNQPFSEGVSKEKYWILENFFSTGVVGNVKE
jgi:hypothetical protein